MSSPGRSCQLEKPVGVNLHDEHEIVSHQLVDMRWQKEEAKVIFNELGKHLRPKEIVGEKAKDLGKVAFQAGIKRATGVDIGPELQELKDLSQELLGLAKKGAKVSHVHAPLASRIRKFLQVSELKGKANRRALRKLQRDLKGFGTKNITKLAKHFGKDLVVGLFLKYAHDFILSTGEQQLAIAQTPGERSAALFLVTDAIVLEAGDNIGDIRFWNADSFWRGVYSDLSKSYREGKLNSASAIWNAWSNAVTREHPSQGGTKSDAAKVPLSVQVMDRNILGAKFSRGRLP
jgi:hypothetical protein